MHNSLVFLWGGGVLAAAQPKVLRSSLRLLASTAVRCMPAGCMAKLISCFIVCFVFVHTAAVVCDLGFRSWSSLGFGAPVAELPFWIL